MNTVDAVTQLESLLDLADDVGLAVRRVPGGADTDHPGGALVRLRDREVLFLDPDASVADQLAVAAGALRGRPQLDERYLPPELRELIEGA